jgi:hypothetical protein
MRSNTRLLPTRPGRLGRRDVLFIYGLRRPHLALRQKRRSLAGRRAMLPASKAMDIQDASSSLTGQAGIGRVTFPRPASTVTVGGAVFGAPNQRRSQ